MKVQNIIDNTSNSKLNQVKFDKEFESQYDKGLDRLNLSRKRLNEFKTYKRFLNRKNLKSRDCRL